VALLDTIHSNEKQTPAATHHPHSLEREARPLWPPPPFVTKDCQGLGLPPGVRGKGIKGRGQGTQLVTPEKPLLLPGVSRVFLPNF